MSTQVKKPASKTKLNLIGFVIFIAAFSIFGIIALKLKGYW